MEKHANWIIALFVGVAIGVVADRMLVGGKSGGTGGTGQPPPFAAAGGGNHKPADLPPNFLKETDLPAGTLAGLSDDQKYNVLKVTNEEKCNCGCQNDTIIECRKKDPNCSTAPQLITTAINLAKQGKNADQIKKDLFGGGAQAAKPRPPQEDPKAVYKIPVEDSPAKGPKDALVTIIESSDFQ
jgi:hypothetical protein